jgi:ankyrin repeat protein
VSRNGEQNWKGSGCSCEYGRLLNNSLDGFTPLHYAARYGKEPEVKRLLEAGVDVEQRNDQGLTPLMMAAIGEHNKCVQILTTFGAQVNILPRRGGQGRTGDDRG